MSRSAGSTYLQCESTTAAAGQMCLMNLGTGMLDWRFISVSALAEDNDGDGGPPKKNRRHHRQQQDHWQENDDSEQ